jgi:hypothetical protein
VRAWYGPWTDREIAMSKPVPSWKFYHPLPFWKAIGIMGLAVLVANILTAVVSLAFDLNFSPAIGGGIGGAMGATLIMLAAQKAKAADDTGDKDTGKG